MHFRFHCVCTGGGGGAPSSCEQCFTTEKIREVVRPETETFNEHLSFFLKQYPGTECPKAGRAQFLPALSYNRSQQHMIGCRLLHFRRARERAHESFKTNRY